MYRTEHGFGGNKIHPLGPDSLEPALRYRGPEDRVWTGDLEYIQEHVRRSNWTEENNEDGEKTVKELCYPMQRRREIRKQQEIKIAKKIGMESWKGRRGKSLRKFQSSVSSFLHYFTLWRGTLQTIGGQFGTGIQSYFTFLRFLVQMNFVTFLLIGGFIVIPNILFELNSEKTFASSNSSDVCSVYKPYPQGLKRFYTFIIDILMGTGFMELTYMFYGHYKNSSLNLSAFFYNIPLAYLVTTLIYFLLSLVWAVKRSVQGFKESLITQDSAMHSYTDKVFASWDFCIKNEKIIKLKQKSILYELKVDLEEERVKLQHAQRTMSQRVGIYSLRIFLNLLVVSLIGGAFYCIYRATQESQNLMENTNVKGNFILELLTGYLPSIVITGANVILPMIFETSIKWEKYTYGTEVKLTLARRVFLRLASLGMLLYSLWDNITCGGNKEAERCRTCGYNYNENHCWETRVGQEMYKLLIFDFLTVLVVILLVDFPRKMMVDSCSCKPIQLWGQQEFMVPQFVLDIIYGQTVCWIGTFFCPLLPLLNTIKYFIIFYLKRLTLFNNCRPAERAFRSSSANFFFLLVLLLGLAISWVPVLYSISSITPSKACGPFRYQETIWETIPTAVNSLPKTSKEFFQFIGSQAFAVPLFILACILMSYLVALANSHGKLVSTLKDQLQKEMPLTHELRRTQRCRTDSAENIGPQICRTEEYRKRIKGGSTGEKQEDFSGPDISIKPTRDVGTISGISACSY